MAYLNRNPSNVAVPVRIGLIGSGWMGALHAESIARRVPGAVLAAIADPNLESAEALAATLGTAKVTADAADILADPEIDAVVIASPARFHSALIGQAAAAGKHVFCARRGRTPSAPTPFTLTPGANDARRALAMALACIESVKQGAPVAVHEASVL